MIIPLLILLGLAAAQLSPLVCRVLDRKAGCFLAAVPLAIFAYLLTLIGSDPVYFSWVWLPRFNIAATFYVDGLSLLFALIISGIGVCVFLYGGGYLAGHRDLGRFYVSLFIFMSAMLGVVMAGDLLTLFVFWELTSLSSYLLIGFSHEQMKSRKAALQALLVTGSGGLAMLAGIILLGLSAGTFDIPELLDRSAVIQALPAFNAILILIVIGALTKSAQFPFHYWLPAAMEAPTPVSAYLHSATMVKAGIFLLARLHPILSGGELWMILVAGAGAITMVMGVLIACVKSDLKQILAYSTVSALGVMTMTLGVGTEYAVKGCMAFLLAHALYKGALFMVAGSVDHEAGTRDIRLLGGLAKSMPFTAGAAFLAALSLAGVLPFFGFVGKEYVIESQLSSSVPLLVAAAFTGAVFVTVAVIVFGRTFLGKAGHPPKHPHEAPLDMLFGPVILAVLGLVVGLGAATIGSALVVPAASATYGQNLKSGLSLWHGFTPALFVSLAAIALGAIFYLVWSRMHLGLIDPGRAWPPGPARLYDRVLDGVNWLAYWQTRIIQNGSLRIYLEVIIVFVAVLVGTALFYQSSQTFEISFRGARVHEITLAIAIVVATLATVLSTTRLAAIVSLGVVGFSISLIFALFGAPDLALTQVLVETLTVLLLILVFYHLPEFASFTPPVARGRDALISLGVGGLMACLVLLASSSTPEKALSAFFSERSYTEAFGRNVVNVILVDFRALDTLGEIAVVGIAAIGVYALLKMKPGRDSK